MAGIQDYLDLIKSAIYGKDVRQAIHDGIQQCYYDGKAGATDLEARQRLGADEANITWLTSRMSTAESDIDTLDARVDQIVSPSGEAPSAAEVADGRIINGYTYPLIGDAIRAVNDNVDSISDSNKNLWTEDSSYTFTTSKAIQFTKEFPAGRYCISAVVTSTDTDRSVCRISIAGKSVDLTRGTRNGGYFDASAPFNSCTLYASQNSSTSSGDTATWSDIQLETGAYPSDYVEHKLTAVDDVAREKVNSLVKYVATTGSDSNDGNTKDTPYATIQKALDIGAETIYVAKGTYTETLPYYTYRNVKIVGDNATLTFTAEPYGGAFDFRYCNVEISGMHIICPPNIEGSLSGILLLQCNAILKDCSVDGASDMGFRLDGCHAILIRCEASNNAIDGFNAHNIVSGYNSEGTFIDCVSHDNVDDGLSYHETGVIHVIGGRYYDNGSTGIAFAEQCSGDVTNAYIYGNGAGIECFGTSGQDIAEAVIVGNIIENNNKVDSGHNPDDIGYGVHAKYYNVKALGNAVVGNNSGAYYEHTGATLTVYTATPNE